MRTASHNTLKDKAFFSLEYICWTLFFFFMEKAFSFVVFLVKMSHERRKCTTKLKQRQFLHPFKMSEFLSQFHLCKNQNGRRISSALFHAAAICLHFHTTALGKILQNNTLHWLWFYLYKSITILFFFWKIINPWKERVNKATIIACQFKALLFSDVY